ncbi:pilus assembly protein PilM [Leucobacter sp. HY1910]
MARTIVGLEVTEEEVRAAEVTLGKNPKIMSHGSVRLPAGAAKDSEVLDRTAVVAALQELWRKTGFKSKRVVLGICSRRVLVRDYRTQAMAPDLLKQALPFQVADLLPVPVDQAVIDFYAVSQEGEQVTGLLVAAVLETVTELVETVGQAKLIVEQVDLAPFGLLRAIDTLTESEETVAVVHLGPHTGYVVIAQQGVPKFVRIMPLDLTEAVPPPEFAVDGGVSAGGVSAGGVSADEPVPALADSGGMPAFGGADLGGERNAATARLFGAPARDQVPIAPQKIDDLVSQILNTMRFHVDRTGTTIDRVLITGVGAGIPGVQPAFQDRLPMPVTRVGGHHLTQQEERSRHGQEDLELLTPVGLAMMGGL